MPSNGRPLLCDCQDCRDKRRRVAREIGFREAWGVVKRRRRLRRGTHRISELLGGK